MHRITAYPSPFLMGHASPVALPLVPGYGAHSYTHVPTMELPGTNLQPSLPTAALAASIQRSSPLPKSLQPPPPKPRLDVTVVHCTPSPENEGYYGHSEYNPYPDETASSYGAAHYGAPPVPPAPIPSGSRTTAKHTAYHYSYVTEYRQEMTADQDRMADDAVAVPLKPPKPTIRAIHLGRYIPREEQEVPYAYNDMFQMPFGYAPAPAGYGHERYEIVQEAVLDGHINPFPGQPVGIPQSHGHPSFIGRQWEAPQRLIREDTSLAQQALPDPDEDMVNNTATLADREYQARVVFRDFDTDNSGTLDLEEFIRAMNHLGASVTPEDAQMVFDMFDEDHSGAMDEEEFVRNYLNNYS